MNKLQYDQQPDKLQAAGDGSFRYRWGIEEVEKTDPFTETKTTFWECFEVTVWNNPTVNSVTEAVITSKWPASLEAKLINDYNAAVLNVLSEDFKQPYLSFLNERNLLKLEIKEFFNEIV